jgi:hypothetical protein
MRQDPDLAAIVPLLATSGPAANPPAPSDTPPVWPRRGYDGSPKARRLEQQERNFIRRLREPVDGRSPVDRLDERLANFADGEAEYRRDGATAARLDRLRYEILSYEKRLGIERALLAQRQEDEHRQAMETSNTIVAAGRRRHWPGDGTDYRFTKG